MTQVSGLKTKITTLKQEKKTHAALTNTNTTPNGINVNGFKMWCLTKGDNDKEYSMVQKNGKKYYFCKDGHSFNGVKCGMYCFHKPGAGHIARKERK